MVSRKQIETAVLNALSELGVPVYTKHQGNTAAKGLFGTILVKQIRDVAFAHVQPEDDTTLTQIIPQRIVVEITVYGNSPDADKSAGEFAQAARDIFTKMTVRDAMAGVGVAVMFADELKDVSVRFRDRYEERAWFDLILSSSRVITETVDVIEHVEIESESLQIPATVVDLDQE